MNQEERKKYILDQLQRRSSISVAELSEAFSLSEVSVRKLLSGMEQEGVLKRTWGGAVSAYGSLREFSHQENEVRQIEEKRAIAREAYACIRDGEAVFLDRRSCPYPKRNSCSWTIQNMGTIPWCSSPRRMGWTC